MWKRIREIVRKELRQTLREPRMRVVLFIPPLIQLIIFGYAVNLDVETSRIAWMDQDRTPASRELFEAFARLGAVSGARRTFPGERGRGVAGPRPRPCGGAPAARLWPRHRPRQDHQRAGPAGRQQFQHCLHRFRLCLRRDRCLRQPSPGPATESAAGSPHGAHRPTGRRRTAVARDPQPRLVQPGLTKPQLLRPRGW